MSGPTVGGRSLDRQTNSLSSDRRIGGTRMGGPLTWSFPRTRRQIVLLSAVFSMALLVGESVTSADTTPTPAAMTACTPGAHPPPGCAYEGPTFTPTPPVSPAPTETRGGCGNGLREGDEECDDGGICIGGTNAGTHCTGEEDCNGNSVCVDGAKAESACADDSACPDGQCIHCRTFSGDGCAANCTAERSSGLHVVSGVLDNVTIVPGTSGIVINGDILTIPLPLDGTLTLTTGNLRLGRIPIVVRAGTVRFSWIPIGLACGCVRGIARKTCGGTLFETDGFPSLDCTPRLTAGDSVCAGQSPCTSLHGDGNALSGVIGCTGLDSVDYRVTQDAGLVGKPSAPQITLSGTGGPGSAGILGTTAIGTIVGACTGSAPDYGPDGYFCTEDDAPNSMGTPSTTSFTTGTATAEVFNANGVSGNTIGPFSLTGAVLDCPALLVRRSPGGTLVSTAIVLAQPTVGDIAVTYQLVLRPGAVDTPPPTATPTPIPPLCIGDCNADGEVTIDELITGVGMALGSVLADACPAFCDTQCGPGAAVMPPTVACLMRGVNYALDGCPIGCVTDQDCDAGNACLLRRCTPAGCQYQCICV